MPAPIRFSSDDFALLVNGIPVGHFTKGRCQPTTASRITDIETAEGPVGQNVPPITRSKPGSGNFGIRITSPDAARLARLSSDGESVSVVFRVIKNKEAYSFSEVGMTHAYLGEVPIGPDAEAPEADVSFRGTGYFIKER